LSVEPKTTLCKEGIAVIHKREVASQAVDQEIKTFELDNQDQEDSS